jgi:hypothetical protein
MISEHKIVGIRKNQKMKNRFKKGINADLVRCSWSAAAREGTFCGGWLRHSQKAAGLLLSKIRHFEIIFFYEFIDICAIFSGQFGSLADVASGEFKQLNQVIFFKILFGILK